ncbi:hypothetical protein GCM10027610_082600 [Dactylosporangium cerinum]
MTAALASSGCAASQRAACESGSRNKVLGVVTADAFVTSIIVPAETATVTPAIAAVTAPRDLLRDKSGSFQ